MVKEKLNSVKKMEGLDEDRWVKQELRENNGRSSWKKKTNRWKRRKNLEEDWHRMEPREVKKRIEEGGFARW